ncbi:3584_t:CDS:1, partial [Racocetra fulgida]
YKMNVEHSANFNISIEFIEPNIQQSDKQILNQEIEYNTVDLTNASTKLNSYLSLLVTTKSKKIKINFNVNINKDKES